MSLERLFVFPCISRPVCVAVAVVMWSAILGPRVTAATLVPGENDRIGWSADGNKNDADGCLAPGAGYYFTTPQGKTKFGGLRFMEWQMVEGMKQSSHPEFHWVHTRLEAMAKEKQGWLDASDAGMERRKFC